MIASQAHSKQRLRRCSVLGQNRGAAPTAIAMVSLRVGADLSGVSLKSVRELIRRESVRTTRIDGNIYVELADLLDVADQAAGEGAP